MNPDAPAPPPDLGPMPASPDERKRMLLARHVKPEHCRALRAAKATNKEWAKQQVNTHPDAIDVSGCPSFEAWNLLIYYADHPDAAFADYAKVGTTKEELEAERKRQMGSETIKRHIERARNAFAERRRTGLPLN